MILDRSCEPLPHAELAVLVRRAQDGDTAARNRIIASTSKLVCREAHKWAERYGCRELVDDLVQVGLIGHRQASGVGGVMRAVAKFDPSRARWSTYVMYWITIEMYALLVEQITGLSRRESTKLSGIRDVAAALELELGRAPRPEDIRAEYEARAARPPSLLVIRRALDNAVLLPDAEEHAGGEAEAADAIDERRRAEELHAAIAELSPDEQHVVRLRLRGRATARVGEAEAAALEKLRHILG